MSPDRQLFLPNPDEPYRERLERIPNYESRVRDFRYHIERLGVDALVFDADNTLFDTFGLFTAKMSEFCTELSRISGLEPKEIKQTMDDLWEKKWKVADNEEINMPQVFGVAPLSLREIARLTALQHGIQYYDENVQNALTNLMSVYHTAPEIIPGTDEVLLIAWAAGVKIVIATHSEDEWAQQKFRDHQLEMPGMKIVTCDVRDQKDKEIFLDAIKAAETTPERVIVVGDSWKSDVEPAIHAGVPRRRIIRVGTEYGLSNGGEVPGVTQMTSIANLEDEIQKMI